MLRNVLSRNIPDGAQPIVPISWYYRTLPVQPVTVGATLVYSVSLPLVSTYTWRFVELHVWPYPVKNGYCSIELPQTVLHNTARDQVVINPQCMGEKPVVCTTHAIHMAEQYPCIQGLLRDIPFYDKTCYIKYSHSVPAPPAYFTETTPEEQAGQDVLYQTSLNVHVLITRSVTVTLRCHGLPTQTLDIPRGIFVISLVYPCTLWTPNWLINSEFSFFSNMTLDSNFVFKLPSAPYFQRLLLDNLTDKFKHLDFDYDKPQRVRISDLDYVPLPEPIQDQMTWYWYLFLLVLLSIPVAWCCWRYRQRCWSRGLRQEVIQPTSEPSEQVEMATTPDSTQVLKAETSQTPLYRLYPMIPSNENETSSR